MDEQNKDFFDKTLVADLLKERKKYKEYVESGWVKTSPTPILSNFDFASLYPTTMKTIDPDIKEREIAIWI